MAWSKAKQMKFLSDAPVIRVATANRIRKPHVTPVCRAVWKEKIYWASDIDAKVADLKHHRRVALVDKIKVVPGAAARCGSVAAEIRVVLECTP